MCTYAISDIHGYYYEFIQMLQKIDFDKSKDYLNILGDAIDRGPHSDKMVEWIIDNYDGNHVDFIIGNHEDRYIKYIEDQTDKLSGKHRYCLNELSSKLSDKSLYDFYNICKSLKYMKYTTVRRRSFILVHAGIRNNRPGDTDLNYAISAREAFYMGKDYKNTNIIFGHTPVQRLFRNVPNKSIKNIKITQLGKKYCIDCGIYLDDGKLACLRLDDMKEIYIEKPRSKLLEIGENGVKAAM